MADFVSGEHEQEAMECWGAGIIVVADDEPDIRTTARSMLELFGFTVVEAADGPEALQAVAEGGGAVVAMLLDLTMPKMDGDEVLRRLRTSRIDLPVVVSSGDSAEASARVAGLGASGFLGKPYTVRQLERCIAVALHRS